MNVNENIERKITDYFNGQLSSVEEAELVQWLKLDEKNMTYFFRFRENLDPNTIHHPLLESSYAELKSKLLINQQFYSRTKDRSKNIQLSFLKIAAMLVLALLAGFSVSYLIPADKQEKAEVVWFETQVPRGEKSQLLLPDGSKVWVNSESSISYPSNFLNGNREIKLNGEAYFEVAKFQNMPFVVKTHDYNILVTGTRFNVMAYSDFSRTETSLIDGKIEIQKGNQGVSVIPGETLTFTDGQFLIKNTNTKIAASWKDDIFDFDQITFRELLTRLERWYDVDIEINTPELYKIVYSGVFKNDETIWQVLNTFQMTLPIRYTRVGFRKFIIEKKR